MEEFIFLTLWTLFADFVFVPLLRLIVPKRFTVRYLLLTTTAVALFLGFCVVLASRH